MTSFVVQGDRTAQLEKYAAIAPRPLTVVYRGTTESTNKTELFINSVDGYVFRPPVQSAGHVEAVCVGYNKTDDTAVAATKTVAVFSRLGATMTVTQGTDVSNVYDDARCQIEADDTDDHVVVSVTAADADTTNWKVFFTIYCLAEEDEGVDQVYDGVPK